MFWSSLRILTWLGLGISLGLASCNLQPNGRDAQAAAELRANLAALLEQHQQAQQQASVHWDQVIFGEGVSCQRGLAVPDAPPPLGPTAPPSAEALHTALRQSQDYLASSARIWDEICGNEAEWVAPALADLGYDSARNANITLQAAHDILDGWQP